MVRVKGVFEKYNTTRYQLKTYVSDSDGVSSPNDEILLFWQKDPKPCWPWHGPLPSQGQALWVPSAVR